MKFKQTFDGGEAEFLRPLFSAEPQLVRLQLEGQSHLSPMLIQHPAQRDWRQWLLQITHVTTVN